MRFFTVLDSCKSPLCQQITQRQKESETERQKMHVLIPLFKDSARTHTQRKRRRASFVLSSSSKSSPSVERTLKTIPRIVILIPRGALARFPTRLAATAAGWRCILQETKRDSQPQHVVFEPRECAPNAS
jgi:hypothetical protein